MIIDNTILERKTEEEFDNRRKIFKIVNDAMESEMIMQKSLECCTMYNDSKTISFPYIDGDMLVKAETLKVESEITKRMIICKDFDSINSKLVKMGKKLGYKFNNTIIKTIIDNSAVENEVFYDNRISVVENLHKCKQKVDAASYHKFDAFGDSLDKIIICSNKNSFKFVNDLELYDLELNNKKLVFILYNFKDAGMMTKSSMMLESFNDEILGNLDKMEACIRFCVSINRPGVISVLRMPSK